MTNKRTWVLALLTVALMLSFATIGMAQKKNKGKPGGKPGGDPPPIQYELHRFEMPAEDYRGGSAIVLEVNDIRELVGYYPDGLVPGGEQPFYLDIDLREPVARNLNDIVFDPDPNSNPDLTILDDWYISAATGINNLGDISCALAKIGDPDQLRGCVIELRPQTGMPRLHLIPDEDWVHTYAFRINDAGIVLGRGNETTCYVYRVPVHGLPGDSEVQLIPEFPFDAWYVGATLTNPVVIGGPSLVKAYISSTNEIFTYDVDADYDAENPSFKSVSGFNIYRVDGFNDWGDFCGSYGSGRKRKKTQKGFWFDVSDVSDDSLHELADMKLSSALNNDGDVIGSSPGNRAILHHPTHGSISLDDTIVAANDAEQTIWDDGEKLFNTLSERDATGFPVVAGSIRRYHPSFSFYYDGYVLIPIADADP